MKVQFFELLASMLFDMDSVRKGEAPMLDMQDMSMGMEYMLIVKHTYFLKLDMYLIGISNKEREHFFLFVSTTFHMLLYTWILL